jgi:hypothetical protein
METIAPTRTIKVIASDGREEIVEIPAGPNAHTRAHVPLKMLLRGQDVRYEELLDGEWEPLVY